jgi:deoxycytidine triphosphate deaminase
MILAGEALESIAEEVMDPTPEVDFVSVDVHVPQDVRIKSHGYKVIDAEETLDMPDDVAATITGRSSHMRKGVTMPGGVVDPEFSGDFALEFFNHSDYPFFIKEGEAAGRLTFFQLRCER